jgi:hypothetical protein
MVGKLVKVALTRLLRFTLHDEVRLLELFSAISLFAWSERLLSGGGFTLPWFSSATWAYAFGVIATVQIGAMSLRHFRPDELRLGAMALAAGVWAMVSYGLGEAGGVTSAILNYALLASACVISGVWLAWKSTSFQS